MYKNTKNTKNRPPGSLLLLATSLLLSTRAPAQHSATALALSLKSGNGFSPRSENGLFHRRLQKAMCFAKMWGGAGGVVTAMPANAAPTVSVKICQMGDVSGLGATSTVEVPEGWGVERILSDPVWSKNIFNVVLPLVAGPNQGWEIDLFAAGGGDKLGDDVILSDYVRAPENFIDGEPPALFALPRDASVVQAESLVKETLLGKYWGTKRDHGTDKAITIGLKFQNPKLQNAVSPGPVQEVQFQFRITSEEEDGDAFGREQSTSSIAVRVGPLPDFSPAADETEAEAKLREKTFWERRAHDIHRRHASGTEFHMLLVDNDTSDPDWVQLLKHYKLNSWKDLVQLTNKPRRCTFARDDLRPLTWATWRSAQWLNGPGSRAWIGDMPGAWAQWQEDNRVAGKANADEVEDDDSKCSVDEHDGSNADDGDEHPSSPSYVMYAEAGLAGRHLDSPELAIDWDGATARVLHEQDL